MVSPGLNARLTASGMRHTLFGQLQHQRPAPARPPFERNLTTTKACTARRVADSDYHGMTEGFSAAMETGTGWIWVIVKAKEKLFQPKIRQNAPATTGPGIILGRPWR